MLVNIQIGQILDLSSIGSLPTSGQSLEYCQTMQQRRRRRNRNQTQLPDRSQVQLWSNQRLSSVLVMECSSTQIVADYLVDIINVIRQSNLTVLWALRFADFWSKGITCTEIIQMLILQALQVNPQAIHNNGGTLTVANFREVENEEGWFAILNRALSGVPQVYLIIDGGILGHATGYNRSTATRWLSRFSQNLSCTVKVVICASTIDEKYAATAWSPDAWMKMHIPIPKRRLAVNIRRRRQRRSTGKGG